MINFFTLGLNQMINLAEQMQRLESELFRIFIRNVSNSTQQIGSLSRMSGSRMFEIAEETTEQARQQARQQAEESMDQMHTAMRPAVSSRAKASPTRQRSKTQPKKRPRKR